MRLLTFALQHEDRLGALTDRGIVDLSASGHSELSTMQRLIESGPRGLEMANAYVDDAKDQFSPNQVQWRSPLPRPAQLRDCLGFEQHLKNAFESAIKIQAASAENPELAEAQLRESGRFSVPDVWYRQPLYYKANRFAVAGTGAAVVWPEYSNLIDFELELACVIWKAGKNIKVSQADDHIFGYTIFNDFSARDALVDEVQGMLGPAKGKDFDGSNVLGPIIVTRDEIEDPYNLTMRARVNGDLWCDGNSSTMKWKFADMISHISKSETLHPGEVIGSGTVGWGCGLEHMKFLEEGDEVELEVERIGKIVNRVIR